MRSHPDTLALAAFAPRSQLRTAETVVHRPAGPVIDSHNHLGRWLSSWVGREGDWVVADVGRLLGQMDELGLKAIVNLDGRFGDELAANLARYDEAHPGRFATFCHVDWAQLDDPARLVASLRESRARGAKGLKVWKDLGLTVADGAGHLVLPDDPRLAPLWHEAGELGLPVLIHTADPIAFFDPIDARNERLEELAAHPEWSFHGGEFPSFWRLMEALEAIVSQHSQTTFVAAHAGCCAEDLGWVSGMLDRHANLAIDISARLAELGRQPRATRRLIERHPTRVLFGTDAFPPDPAVYRHHYRFLESDDEAFDYAPWDEVPPSGRWQISALGLGRPLLDQLYHLNAERLLGLT